MTARPLLEELHRTAEQEHDAARRSALDEADAIRNAARAEAARAHTDALGRHGRIATRDLARARADATRAANQRLLPARAAALDRVFAVAEQRIEALAAHPRLQDAISSLVNDAIRYLPDGAARARCMPGMARQVRHAFECAGRADAVVTEVPGTPLGVIVESADGVVSVDATFARRLAHDRRILATEIAARLAAPQP